MHIPEKVTADMRLLYKSLFAQSEGAVHKLIYSIALLIPCKLTSILLSNAAHSGLGGWSSTFHFLWRLTHADMVKARFQTQELDDQSQEHYQWCKKEDLPEGHKEWLHINPLEYIAIIVNVLFGLIIPQLSVGSTTLQD